MISVSLLKSDCCVTANCSRCGSAGPAGIMNQASRVSGVRFSFRPSTRHTLSTSLTPFCCQHLTEKVGRLTVCKVTGLPARFTRNLIVDQVFPNSDRAVITPLDKPKPHSLVLTQPTVGSPPGRRTYAPTHRRTGAATSTYHVDLLPHLTGAAQTDSLPWVFVDPPPAISSVFLADLQRRPSHASESSAFPCFHHPVCTLRCLLLSLPFEMPKSPRGQDRRSHCPAMIARASA